MGKNPRKPKTKADAPGAAPPPPAGDNHDDGKPNGLTDAERQQLFCQGIDQVLAAKAKLATATADFRNARKRMKADGFALKEVDAAVTLSGDDGESKLHEEIAARLRAARWLGLALGSQLEMFEQPDRTPDRISAPLKD